MPPPSRFKHEVILRYACRHSCKTLVETGTYLGECINCLREDFSQIISIELDPGLHARARRRFARQQHVKLLLGNSEAVLGEVLIGLNEAAVFWLDAHYSGGVTARGETDTPILDELRLILGHPVRDHVLLVDDARCFGNDPAYPTIDEIRAMVQSSRPDLSFEVRDDIIRIEPAPGSVPFRPPFTLPPEPTAPSRMRGFRRKSNSA